MRRLCVVLSIASLCLFGTFDAHIARPDPSTPSSDAAALASMPIAAAAQLAALLPTSTLRDGPSALVAIVPAAIVLLLALAIEVALRGRRVARARPASRTTRTRGPPELLFR